MEGFTNILQYVYAIAIFLVGAVPTLVALFAAIKKCKKAESAEEKSNAVNEMKAKVGELIVNAETLFKEFDTFSKNKGQSAGAIKKEEVLVKLQAYALENGYEFDKEYWSNEIDAEVAVTKQVNSK